MAEVYPSDSALLNMVSDGDTGVDYIATGTAPYYLHFRKLLHRLLLATKRGNDFRVFDEGGLDVGIKSGKFWAGMSLVSYGGSSGNTLADDTAAIYVYLDSTGSLVTNEYAGFPDMGTTKHMRLAVVTTSGGDITSVVDSRDHHSMSLPSTGGGGGVIEVHTANDTLTEVESGSIHSNLGATGVVTLTLPGSASGGTTFTFVVQASQQFCIDPGVATIRDNSGFTPDKYKWANTIGECITLVADANGDWVTIAKNGIWAEEV